MIDEGARPVWLTEKQFDKLCFLREYLQVEDHVDSPTLAKVIADWAAAPTDSVTEVAWLLANCERVGAFDVLGVLGYPKEDA